MPVTDYDGLADAMFHTIRQNAAGSAYVLIRLVEVLTRVAEVERLTTRRAVLARHLPTSRGAARTGDDRRGGRDDGARDDLSQRAATRGRGFGRGVVLATRDAQARQQVGGDWNGAPSPTRRPLRGRRLSFCLACTEKEVEHAVDTLPSWQRPARHRFDFRCLRHPARRSGPPARRRFRAPPRWLGPAVTSATLARHPRMARQLRAPCHHALPPAPRSGRKTMVTKIATMPATVAKLSQGNSHIAKAGRSPAASRRRRSAICASATRM